MPICVIRLSAFVMIFRQLNLYTISSYFITFEMIHPQLGLQAFLHSLLTASVAAGNLQIVRIKQSSIAKMCFLVHRRRKLLYGQDGRVVHKCS